MKRRDPADPVVDPWRAPVVVAQIPESGLALDIEAGAAQRTAMAEIAGLTGIAFARAEFQLTPERDGRVNVVGHLQARVGQTCVVTLDPVENDIDESIDLTFAPPDQIKQLADLLEDDDKAAEQPEPQEPIIGGVIDLGRLATDVLFLAIDPYPRKAGAVFEARLEAPDPEDHPFAALKDFRPVDGDKGQSKKPERK